MCGAIPNNQYENIVGVLGAIFSEAPAERESFEAVSSRETILVYASKYHYCQILGDECFLTSRKTARPLN
jgi:hypothetical protein